MDLLSELQYAEFKEAFNEFDKVGPKLNNFLYILIRAKKGNCSAENIENFKLFYISGQQWHNIN